MLNITMYGWSISACPICFETIYCVFCQYMRLPDSVLSIPASQESRMAIRNNASCQRTSTNLQMDINGQYVWNGHGLNILYIYTLTSEYCNVFLLQIIDNCRNSTILWRLNRSMNRWSYCTTWVWKCGYSQIWWEKNWGIPKSDGTVRHFCQAHADWLNSWRQDVQDRPGSWGTVLSL